MTAFARADIHTITAETTATMPASATTPGRALVAASETQTTSHIPTVANTRQRVTSEPRRLASARPPRDPAQPTLELDGRRRVRDGKNVPRDTATPAR